MDNLSTVCAGIEVAAAKGHVGLVTDLVTAVDGGATLSVLRAKHDNGRPGVLLRVLFPDAGTVHYFHLILTRDDRHQICVGDCYSFFDAEYISDTLRRFLAAAIDEDSRGVVDRLSGKHNVYIKSLPKLAEMRTNLQQGNYQKVLDIYHELPREVQHDRVALVYCLAAASSAKEYARAAAHFRRYAGKDARIDLVLYYGYLLNGQLDEALECLDHLDRDIGGDAYICVLRTGIYLDLDDIDAARREARTAVYREPDLIEGYWARLRVALLEQEFGTVVDVMESLVDRFDLQVGDLTEVPEYAEFVKSPQYAALAGRTPEGRDTRGRTCRDGGRQQHLVAVSQRASRLSQRGRLLKTVDSSFHATGRVAQGTDGRGTRVAVEGGAVGSMGVNGEDCRRGILQGTWAPSRYNRQKLRALRDRGSHALCPLHLGDGAHLSERLYG